VESTDAWNEAWPQSVGDFERLVDTYLQRLVQHAFRRLGSMPDAEDVVQDVFVRAYARRAECAAISPVGPYLYRMVTNACTDVLRRRGRTETSMSRLVNKRHTGDQTDASAQCAAAEEMGRIEELLRRLPKRQAAVVRLRVFDEMRLNEIAQVVGCSTNTVGCRLRYGFRKLRRIVSREWKE